MKRYFHILLLLALLATPVGSHGQRVIPSPVRCDMQPGEVVLTADAPLLFDEELREAAEYLCEYIPFRRVGRVFDDITPSLRLKLDKKLKAEDYAVVVDACGITICGGGYDGVFNGVQTLFQLLPAEVYSSKCRFPLTVGYCRIEDSPRFGYRGLSLDVARTYIPADKVKRYINLISYHKINKLHFHLTDDEGWRIEIKSHPELARVGGFRGGDSPIYPRYAKFGEKWGGYYTQDELRDIVAYAARRNIEVIPEIDLPGHSKAFAAIHPEILCSYKPDGSRTNGREIRNVWCASKESNYALIEDIISELSGIFTSEYIHIGGDEVDMSQWRRCPDCQRLKHEHGLRDEKQIEDYFIARVTAILAKYGRKPAVWNEAIEGGLLPKNTRVHGWQSIKHCKESVAKGYPTIIMPGEYFYLDMKQSEGEPGHTWAAIFDARKVLSFNIDGLGFKPPYENVAGIEASFFSEIYIAHSPEKSDYLDYMLFPRLCAVAEVAWSRDKATWAEFYNTLKERHYDRMRAMGIAFRLSTPKVTYAGGRLTASTDDGAELFYRNTDGGEVRRYSGAIPCSDPCKILFHSEYGAARSREIGSAEYYRMLEPAVKVTSSMSCSERNPISYAESYDTRIARTTRAAHAGDWILYSFDKPLTCREIEAQTGHIHLRRCLFLSGGVEISRDGGRTFERVAELVDGGAVIRPQGAVTDVRIVAEGDSDAEDNVVIQSLKIK